MLEWLMAGRCARIFCSRLVHAEASSAASRCHQEALSCSRLLSTTATSADHCLYHNSSVTSSLPEGHGRSSSYYRYTNHSRSGCITGLSTHPSICLSTSAFNCRAPHLRRYSDTYWANSFLHRQRRGCLSSSALSWRAHRSPSLLDSVSARQPEQRGLAQDHVTTERRRVVPQLRVPSGSVRTAMQQITRHENIYTVPNVLCVARIALTPLIGWMVVQGMYTPALIGFCLAGGTDMLDGWIARKYPSQASRLGSFLDPLADKLLMSVLVVSLTYAQLLPPVLTLLIVGRDIGLIAAASWVRYKSVPPPVTLSRYFDVTYATAQLEPTTISKVNTCIQLALVASTLAAPVFGFVDHTALHVLWCITAGTTVTSGLIYALLKEDTFKLMRHDR